MRLADKKRLLPAAAEQPIPRLFQL